MENEKLLERVIDYHMEDMRKMIKKNKRRITGLKFTVAVLVIYSLGLAAELAERKRCENYLQTEIDDLKERIYISKSEKESDGGAADA